jgi:hypothetical protein
MGAQNQARQSSQEVACQETPSGATTRQATAKSDMWRKFAEPRGWALRWDGVALSGFGQSDLDVSRHGR